MTRLLDDDRAEDLMTADSPPVKAFPDLEEKYLNDAAAADQRGPLPCGCFRVEVYDFGHRYTCRDNAEAYPNRNARYDQLIDLCRRIVAAHDADDGGPTVAGSLLAELGRRLNARPDSPAEMPDEHA